LTLAGKARRVKFEAVDNILSLEHLKTLIPRFRALREEGLDLSFMYETKANLRKDQLRLLKEAGITALQPGIESLDNDILRIMRKGCTAVQNIRLLKWCAEMGIHPIWNVLYGLPGEPEGAYQRMAARIPHLVHLTPPNLRRLNLDRFSPYQRDPEAHGVEVLGPSAHYPLLYDVDEATLMDLAYTFRYRYRDGRDPEVYVAPLRQALDFWTRCHNPSALVYWRGPGFMVFGDSRGRTSPVEYVCDDLQARIYLSCDAGVTVEGIMAALDGEAKEDFVRECLAEMLEAGLLFEEEGQYVSLALPASRLV
jgi:ribosomal peptide maturation radical SAM protein 1